MFSACGQNLSKNSTTRSELINWAKKITSIELDYLEDTSEFNLLVDKLGQSPPTNQDCEELAKSYKKVAGFYSDLLSEIPPTEAHEVHSKYVKQYAQASNGILYYQIAVCQNDFTYFEKSVIASQEANRVGNEAYLEFVELMKRYSITCTEIDYCETGE